MQYSWQLPDWPNYHYSLDDALASVYQYAQNSGTLSGRLERLEHQDQFSAVVDLMLTEAITSSQIEGEQLNRDDVRSSLRNHLGLNASPVPVYDKRAHNMAAMMVDVRRHYNQPLSTEILLRWHGMLFSGIESTLHPVLVGQFRNSTEPMQIVSGPIGYEQIHYQAPPSQQVPEFMLQFIAWYNQNLTANPSALPAPVMAAIAHLYFETIHPFDDGNGRIGRAIAEHALSFGLGHPAILSLSSVIEQNRNQYYQALHKASAATLDITGWVNYFTDVVNRAQSQAQAHFDFVLNKARFWDAHQRTAFNQRQKKVLSKLFEAGPEGFAHGLSASQYKNMAKCSKATATRDLAELVNLGALQQQPAGGRSTRYKIAFS